MTTGTELINRFEQFASPQLAESWDHVGLQTGTPDRPIQQLMTTLDVRPEIVQEAIDQQIDFIFAHHPIMFKPATDLDVRNPQNQMYADLLSHQITVYAAHTNLDTANGGMNDWLADQLGLMNCEPLVAAGQDPFTKQPVGMGRVGQLPNAMTIDEFTRHCQSVFGVAGLRLVKPASFNSTIQRVAVLGGAGGSFYQQALQAGADAYVTGDISYHTGHDIIANGLVALDPGHHIEAVATHRLAELFKQWQLSYHWKFEIIENQINTDPFEFICKEN